LPNALQEVSDRRKSANYPENTRTKTRTYEAAKWRIDEYPYPDSSEARNGCFSEFRFCGGPLLMASECKPVNLGRHESNCTICSHPQREEIEREFVEWASPLRIAEDFALPDRKTVYRHARAFGLLLKRDRNIRAGLAKIIERGGEVEISAAAVVAAIQAYSKINSLGQWVDRNEHINLNELFDRMTRDELERYATDGKLPDWFARTVSAPVGLSQESLSD
jgi:hypothetical protein